MNYYLDCGCHVGPNGRTLCPSCSMQTYPPCDKCSTLRAENERMRAALQTIAQNLSGLCTCLGHGPEYGAPCSACWNRDYARAALDNKD
jgi:hypothetical protein